MHSLPVLDVQELPDANAVTAAFPPATHLLLRAGSRTMYVTCLPPEERWGLAQGPDGVADAASIGLSSEQQDWLGVRAGTPIDVEPILLPSTSTVTVLPLFGDEDGKADQDGLRAWLVENRVPLQVGARLRAPLPGKNGQLYEVLEVADAGGVAVLDADGECRVEVLATSAIGQDRDIEVLDLVPGLREQVRLISRLVRTPLQEPWRYRRLGLTPPRGLILHGPPGAGKTFLARATAHSLGVHAEFLSGAEVVHGGRGESEAHLRTVFSRAARNAPSIVVVDEIDAVVPARERLDAQADYRLVAQFLSLLDGLRPLEGVTLIGTTNLLSRIDPALRRPGRLDLELYVGPPDGAERTEILSWYLDRMPLTAEARQATGVLAESTWGYLPADLMAICRQAGFNALSRELGGAAGAAESVTAEDLHRAAAQVEPSMLRGVTTVSAPGRRLADLGLGAERHNALLAAVAACADRGDPLRLLFVDGEGDGRDVAEAVAAATGQRLLLASPTDFVSPWFGETEVKIRDFFALARAVAPVTVGLLHLEGLTGAASGSAGSGLERVAAQLLDELADRHAPVNVVASINRADLIDHRLSRGFVVV
jgi:transitional endoplasmic reticulum ATPase